MDMDRNSKARAGAPEHELVLFIVLHVDWLFEAQSGLDKGIFG